MQLDHGNINGFMDNCLDHELHEVTFPVIRCLHLQRANNCIASTCNLSGGFFRNKQYSHLCVNLHLIGIIINSLRELAIYRPKYMYRRRSDLPKILGFKNIYS